MLSAADIFARFKPTGQLRVGVWLPANGGPGNDALSVRVMKGQLTGMGMLSSPDTVLQFVKADAAGVLQGDTISIGDDVYVLREPDQDNTSDDGTLVAYSVRRQ